MPTVFGKNVVKQRKACRLLQKDLFVATGISQRHMSAIEHGRADPTLALAQRIAQALGVTVSYLLEEPCRVSQEH